MTKLIKSLSRRSSLLLLASAVGLGATVTHAQQSPVGVQEPAWAPDGKHIAVSYLDRLWVMTPDGKQPKALTNSEGSTVEREPAWSADGSKIAFAADKGNGFDIFVINLKNGAPIGSPIVV